MIELSMQAALLIYSICFIIGFVFMALFYYFIEHKNKLYFNFLLFFLLSTIGSLMILFRADLGTFTSIIIANTLLVIGNIFLVFGVRKIFEYPNKSYFYIIVLAIHTILFLYFTYIYFNVMARVYIYNFTVMILLSYAIFSIIDYKNKNKDRTINELMSTTLTLIVITMLLRVVGLMFFKETTNEFLSFQRDPLNVAIVGLANVLVVSGMLSVVSDHRNKQLIESERSKTSLLSNLPGFAYRCLNDEFWTMKYLSDGFEVLTGYKKDQVIENKDISFQEIIKEEFREDVRINWDRALDKNERYVGEYQIQNSNAESIWIWEQGIGIYDDENQCVAIEGFITNIDSRKHLEKNLKHLSYKDTLTGLYNRRFIEEQIIRLEKSRQLPITIIMGDINGLKFINDSFGHEHGDDLIKKTAEILESSLRGHELISRLSGDEFLMILENTSFKNAKTVVARIQEKCKSMEYQKMGLSISLGYATKDNIHKTLADTRKEAEDMMYKQKIYEKPSIRRKTVDAVLTTLFEKDQQSEQHSQNVSVYSKMLAKAAGLSQNKIKQTETAALLHDVGKIIIDKRILTKDTLLTDDEYDEVKKHTEIGYRILSSVQEFKDIAKIILCHHERPDGLGYPNKLKDDKIPYISKIISICDAYDAMVNERLYKTPMSKEEAFQELRRCAGKQFDTDLVELFIDLME